MGGSWLWGALSQQYYSYFRLTCKETEVHSLKTYLLTPVRFKA